MGTSNAGMTMEFVRPVVGGLDDVLLPEVLGAGRKIRDDFTRGVIKATYASGRSRFREYSPPKIQLPFLCYTAKPTTDGFKPNLYRLASLLGSPPKRPKSELAIAIGRIPKELHAIAREYDTDEKSATAICGNLSIEKARNKKGFELILGVQNPERFRAEGDVFNSKFALRSNIESQTHLEQNRHFGIPLAWFDASLTPQELEGYLDEIGRNGVSGQEINLGPISWYVKPTSEAL